MEWTMPAFAVPAEAGTHLPTPKGWKAELAGGKGKGAPLGTRIPRKFALTRIMHENALQNVISRQKNATVFWSELSSKGVDAGELMRVAASPSPEFP